MIVSTRGVDFRIVTGGPERGDPVLLLHGFPQHSGMWDPVAAALHDAGMRTFAPDLRGYSPGVSTLDDFAMPALVGDVLALLDHLGLSRVDVVGHDWGAVIGWHLAASHAERVRSLTAIAIPHPVAVTLARHTDGGDQRERSSYMEFFAIEGKAEDTLLAEDARRLWALFDPLPREVAARYVTRLLDRTALTGALNWYRRLERPRLGQARVPVTYLYGTHDLAIGPAAANACGDYVEPGQPYRFVTLAGVSHWIVDEAPDAVIAEVLRAVCP